MSRPAHTHSAPTPAVPRSRERYTACLRAAWLCAGARPGAGRAACELDAGGQHAECRLTARHAHLNQQPAGPSGAGAAWLRLHALRPLHVSSGRHVGRSRPPGQCFGNGAGHAQRAAGRALSGGGRRSCWRSGRGRPEPERAQRSNCSCSTRQRQRQLDRDSAHVAALNSCGCRPHAFAHVRDIDGRHGECKQSQPNARMQSRSLRAVTASRGFTSTAQPPLRALACNVMLLW